MFYRAGYLESGVQRIVDQVMEQKMDFIQSKVEEILYQYVGISKPIKKEKNLEEALEVKTDLLPTDLELEQVSPDSDKKSSTSDNFNVEEIKDEEIEEEIVEDDDFESPAFEPIEPMEIDKNEQSQHSNLSAISGLTSQDSIENKEEPTTEIQEQHQQDSQLSQISSIQDMSQEAEPVLPAALANIEEESAPMEVTKMDTTASEQKEEFSMVEEATPEEPEKSQFDLKKDIIEFTGTERKSMPLDDSTNSAENEKVLQSQDVQPNTMEIENLYENDTTDSSEMRMEIDLKDESTQETAESSKIEESSQDSTVSKDKRSEHKKDSHHHNRHKSDRSRDKHKSSSSHKSSHHHRSSSSKSRHDDKSKSRSDGKSHSSSSQKKSSSEKDRSSSSRRDHDKDKKSSKDDSSRSKHREQKKTDDHHQEKSFSRRRKSNDSNDGKGGQDKSGSADKTPAGVTSTTEPSKNTQINEKKEENISATKSQETTDNIPMVVDKMLNENNKISIESSSASSSSKKDHKSSILVKYDYLKSPPKTVEVKQAVDKIEEGFLGFTEEEKVGPINPWFDWRNDACERKKFGEINRLDEHPVIITWRIRLPKEQKVNPK